MDLAATLPPTVTLHGIDIEIGLVPDSRPANCSFSKASITDLPQDWTDTFDLINQRLLVSALTTKDWEKATGEMYRVVKQGGYVQLVEALRIEGGPQSDRALEVFTRLHNLRGIPEPSQVESYTRSMMQGKGFDIVSVQHFDARLGLLAGPLGKGFRDNWEEIFNTLKTTTFDAGGLGMFASEAEYDQFVEDAVHEWDTTDGCKVAFCIIVAQKPKRTD